LVNGHRKLIAFCDHVSGSLCWHIESVALASEVQHLSNYLF